MVSHIMPHVHIKLLHIHYMLRLVSHSVRRAREWGNPEVNNE
jgi:hypothetical protein